MTPFIRPSRSRHGPDPYLNWKMALFAAGAAFGLAGMLAENSLLIGVGIVILAAGFVLRFARRGDDERT